MSLRVHFAGAFARDDPSLIGMGAFRRAGLDRRMIGHSDIDRNLGSRFRPQRYYVALSLVAIWERIRALFRITMIALLAVTVSGLISGCGVGNGRSGGDGPHRVIVSIGKAQAVAYAHAINLRAADLPGMAVSGQEGEFNGLPFGNGVDHCGSGVGRAGVVVGVISPAFISRPVVKRHVRPDLTVIVGPTEGIYSTVHVMRSEALAVRTAEAVGSARTLACLKARRSAHPTELAGEQYKADVDFSSLPPLLPRVRLYGFRERTTLPVAFGDGRTRPPVYVDVIGFPLKQSVVVLRVRSTPRPAPVATERRLLILLLDRAKIHQL
jgi:hypothetical protein